MHLTADTHADSGDTDKAASDTYLTNQAVLMGEVVGISKARVQQAIRKNAVTATNVKSFSENSPKCGMVQQAKMWQCLRVSVKVPAMLNLRFSFSTALKVMCCLFLICLLTAQAQSSREIIVAPGDTLSALASTHNVTVDELVQTNALDNVDLRVGDILVLPGQPYTRTTYRVKAGDTLTELAVAFDLAVSELQDINQLETNNLQVGQLLYLTSDGLSENTTIVQPGDTLSAIASRHSTTIEALQIANNLVNTRINVGQRLLLPSSADTVPESYTVRTGDTLYDIAVAFDMTTDELIARNDLDGTIIQVGQSLTLRNSTPLEPLQVTVSSGDSLWAIASTHDVTVRALRDANNLAGSAVLRPGDTLSIPGRFASTNQAADVGGSLPRTVTVARGDTLSAIASRNGTSVTALMSANSLQSTRIEAGQVLRVVPGSQLQPAAVAAATPTPPAPSTPATVTDGLVWPLSGVITSRFGYRRLRIGGSNFHTGLDIDGETGDPIVAAASGTVTFSGWYGGYGNLVIVQSGNIEYYYAHASTLLVNEGTQVQAGQRVALVGTTGRVTGSHLHFEIRVDDRPIDPLPVLERRASL
ncbi:MAG: LysM peptidoglycan-binding domain-containing protein [Deinococcota bacterium]